VAKIDLRGKYHLDVLDILDLYQGQRVIMGLKEPDGSLFEEEMIPVEYSEFEDLDDWGYSFRSEEWGDRTGLAVPASYMAYVEPLEDARVELVEDDSGLVTA
jgi:hypothetical protein